MSMTMAELVSQYEEASQKLDKEMQLQLERLAEVGKGLMKQSIQRHHAVDTSTMLNSVDKKRAGSHSWEIGPTVAEYPVYVALGTRYMAARPFHIDSARELEKQAKILNIPAAIGLD